MTDPDQVVFLFDVDNTLLDNDRVREDLGNHLEHEFGATTRDRYFAILQELYVELGYADYLGALQRYRIEDRCDPRLLTYPPADLTIERIGDLVDCDSTALIDADAGERPTAPI